MIAKIIETRERHWHMPSVAASLPRIRYVHTDEKRSMIDVYLESVSSVIRDIPRGA